MTIQQLAQITDDVWHAAGDKSTDYNWYTKRGLLAGVYTATELYMLTDYSPEFADTWDVLDRRLQDVMTIGKLLGQVKPCAELSMAPRLLHCKDAPAIWKSLLGCTGVAADGNLSIVLHGTSWQCLFSNIASEPCSIP